MLLIIVIIIYSFLSLSLFFLNFIFFFSYSHITFVLDAYFYMLKKWPPGEIRRFEPSNGSNSPQTGVMCQADRFFGQNMAEFNAERFEEKQKAVIKVARFPYIWLAPRSQKEMNGAIEAGGEAGSEADIEAGCEAGYVEYLVIAIFV